MSNDNILSWVRERASELGIATDHILRVGGDMVRAAELTSEYAEAFSGRYYGVTPEEPRYYHPNSLESTLERMRSMRDSFPYTLREALRDYRPENMRVRGIEVGDPLNIEADTERLELGDGRRITIASEMLTVAFAGSTFSNSQLRIDRRINSFFNEIFGHSFYYFVFYLIHYKLFPRNPTNTQWEALFSSILDLTRRGEFRESVPFLSIDTGIGSRYEMIYPTEVSYLQFSNERGNFSKTIEFCVSYENVFEHMGRSVFNVIAGNMISHMSSLTSRVVVPAIGGLTTSFIASEGAFPSSLFYEDVINATRVLESRHQPFLNLDEEPKPTKHKIIPTHFLQNIKL